MTSGFNTAEIIPYVIGSLITLALIKWLFGKGGKVDDRPINSPSLYFSYSPDPETIREIQEMFPNIPRAYITRELDRADGVASVAIDNLILLAPDFMNLNGANDSSERLSTTPMMSSAPTTHHNIIKSLKSTGLRESTTSDSSAPLLNKKNWDSVDSQDRQQIISERKRQMLMEARERFINTKQ